MAELHHYKPDYASPPGALLQEYLTHLNISGRELARRCGRSPKLIAEILLGKAPVEPETALQLERVLETSATIWLGMEANYRLQLARDEEDSQLAKHLGWAKTFPIKDLAKRGVLKISIDPATQVREVLAFFGCGNVEACQDRFKELSAAAYRHSPSFASSDAALLAWLRIGDLKAETIEAADFDRAKFLAALKRIRGLTTERPEVFLPELKRICAEAGVIFLLEPALPKVALSGVSRWLTSRRALIQQTARHLSNDHFWFTFFHECAHLLLHSRKDIFLDGKNLAHSDPELEAKADDWAADFLVPAKAMTHFITRYNYRADEIIAFAERQGVAPGIVVGQLQHRKVLPFSRMNKLKDHFKWEGT
jgi:HTH-type transcriptional regulator / antitoxin HigA